MATSNEPHQAGEPAQSQQDKAKEQLYKVLVIGDFGVGRLPYVL